MFAFVRRKMFDSLVFLDEQVRLDLHINKISGYRTEIPRKIEPSYYSNAHLV